MIFGYEILDSYYNGWNFNGRYEVPAQLYDAEKEVFYLEMIKTIVNPTLYLKASGLTTFTLPYIGYSDVKHLAVDQITDQSYFYPIFIYSPRIFCTYIEKLSISPKVRKDVENGQAKIVILFPTEGDQYRFFIKFQEIISTLNLHKDNIFFIHSDLNIEKWQGLNFNYISCNHFLYSLGKWYQDGRNLEVSYDFKFLFLSYNRNSRPQRIILLNELVKNNLTNRGLLSFRTRENELEQIRKQSTYELLPTEVLRPYLEIELDQNTWKNLPSFEINWQHHQNSFVSIVTESICNDKNDIVFLTEKIYKPILALHPFLVVGAKNYLVRLREIGFKTFNNFWSEDYDTFDSSIERIKAVVDNIKNLSTLRHEELVKMKTDMAEILEHNRSLLICFLDKQVLPYGKRENLDHHTSSYLVLKDLYEKEFNCD
jgi:hypothetical protein